VQLAQSDIIVIGGGLAGLVAANRAAQFGLRATVLEKGTAAKYLCNSRYTGGTFHISYNDVGSDRKDLLAAIETATAGFARPEIADAVATDGIRLVKWLRDAGARFVNLGQYHTYVLAPPSRTGPGLDWEGRAGDVLIDTLDQRLSSQGGEILRGHAVTGIEPISTGWAVSADTDAGVMTFEAKAVVIADGGYASDLGLLRDADFHAPEKLHQRNARTATGDGLRLARAVGAGAVETPSFYGHLLSRDAFTNDKLWPRPYLDALAVAGILVDGTGCRFADEGEGGVPLANAVARLYDPMSAVLIIDQDIWQGPGASPMIPANPYLPEVGGTMHKASTLVELAGFAGLPAEALQTSVAQYNQALRSGALDQLSPPRRADRHKPLPIAKAPFYAIPICSGITNTMGGISIDGNGAVLRPDGTVIAGLFAAGATIGGLEGGENVGYVGGLIKAVFGLRAAEQIAVELNSKEVA
jgi:fumarate reductase flavoprotein subunit